MGWTSNADPFSNLRLDFETLDSAIEYAHSHGFAYEVEEEVPKPENVPPKDYGHNFRFVPPAKSLEDLL